MLCSDFKRRRSASFKELDSLSIELDPDKSMSQVISLPSLRSYGFIDRIWYNLSKVDQETGSFRTTGFISGLFRKIFTLLHVPIGDYSISWIPFAKKAASVIADNVKIDVCIGEHSPDAGLMLADWFNKKYNVPWLADFRDPCWQGYRGFSRYLYQRFVKTVVKSCRATIAVNPAWQQGDQEFFFKQTYLITNGFDEEEYSNIKETKNDFFTISYTGSIKGYQNINIFLEGLSLLFETYPEVKPKVYFIYAGPSRQLVEREVSKLGLSGRVIIQQLSRKDAIDLQRDSDVLLLLSATKSKIAHFSKGFYPGKVFEYFGAGKFIMCVPGDEGILNELIGSTESGKVLRNPLIISKELWRLWKTWKKGDDLIPPYHEKINQYTRSNLSLELDRILTLTINEGLCKKNNS